MFRSFDNQFADVFISISRYRDEVEKTVAALSLVGIQSIEQMTSQLKDDGRIQWNSE